MSKSPLINRHRKWPLLVAAAALLAISTARADYPALIQSDHPKAYYRLNDANARTLLHQNLGTLGAAGNATNDPMYFKGGQLPTGVVHPFPGAIVGDPDRSEFFDSTTRTEIPFNPAFNTPNTQPFTVEAWFYPASDQTGTGQAPINNRYTSGSNRQGWTFFQRRPDSSYFPGDNGLGWNFRMYNGVGGNTPMDIQSLAPYQVGKWQHVVVVYDPVAANNATLSIYIDGVLANTMTYTGTDPGYAPCTGDHPPAEATSGQPNLSIGCYNNANTGLNPYFGAVDEFAWYSNKLSAAQILAHYQNGTNANRGTNYDILIKSANPVVYLRLNEIAPGSDVAINLGDVRSNGISTNTAEVRHPSTSPLVGRTDAGAISFHRRNGSSTTALPYLPENNPNAGIPFTFETWLRPMKDEQSVGQSPVNNRWVGVTGGTGRTGWVIFQRNPRTGYPGTEGHGWNFRMYSGVGGGGQDVVTDVDYTVGKWQHLVVTWEPQFENGDVGGNGNDQWSGILTAYVDGVAVASNTAALYAANRAVTESGDPAADLAVGSYNAASGLGSNPFEGDVAELAFYSGYVLTPDQILAHYQAASNANYGTNYETLVFTAGFTGPERSGLPKTYLRFNDPAAFSAANSGTLGSVANGNLVLTSNSVAGPQRPTYPGFDSSNAAAPFDGLKQWASFNNPAALNLSGQISLEAWVKPGASQPATARIISHGPQTLTDYPGQGFPGSVTNTTEVFLRIEGSGASYAVGSASYDDGTTTTTTHEATIAVPGGDLGSTTWIHLVGTYDGANWKLYRNGVLAATQSSAVGALPVDLGDWALASSGNGWADPFAGSLDEVAVYDYALSSSQVLAHYKAGTVTPKLSINRSGTNVILSWPYGQLYQADNLTGPWTAVPGNPSSPLTNSPSGTKKFYRF
jgi:hypothetical protein